MPLDLGALILFVAGALCVRRGVKAWRAPRESASLKHSANGFDASMLTMGAALLCAGFLDLGLAISGNGARSNVGSPMTVAAGVALMPLTFLFISTRYLGRPRFLIPPSMRPHRHRR
jgi:hypothetical protein